MRSKQNVTTTGTIYDKLSPYSGEAEKAVIGALLIQADAIHEVYSLLKKDYFYNDALGNIYDVVRTIWENGGKPDLIRVIEELKKRGQLEEVGGPYGLSVLSGNIGTTANIREHAEYVHQSYLKRQLILSAQSIIGKASDSTIDIADTINESLAMLENLSACMEYGNVAKPDMAKHAALSGVPVVFFALEMDAARLADRLIMSTGDIQSIPYRGGWLSDAEKSIMFNSVGFVEQLPIYIDDSPNLHIKQIKARCINLQRKGMCGMVFIDYLGLMEMKSDNRSYTREQEVTQTSRQAKLLAKELNVPVILLSQLNRGIEGKMSSSKGGDDIVPGLADLRESGSIEQDADVVLMIHRPEYYDSNAEEGLGIINIAKQREGTTGKVKFRYNKSLTVLYDEDDVQHDGNPF